jgi:cell wall assembly regulator SMI1
MLTEQLLDRLSATWRAHGAPIEDALAPGRTVESFTSDDGSLHVDLPEELRMWWAWHDGDIEGVSAFASQMGPLRQPMSSTWSRDHWQRMLAMAPEMAADGSAGTPLADPSYWWREAWVPLFSDGSGYLVADCEVGPPIVTPIRRVEWGMDLDGVPAPRTDSLGQLIEMWIEAIELGFWTFDRDRCRWLATYDDPAIATRYAGLI